MKKYISFLSVVFVVIISGCALIPYSETYLLNRTDIYPLEGYIISKPYTVEKTKYTDEVIIHDNGITAIKKNELTIYSFDATVKIKEGTGIRFYLRSTYTNFKNNPVIHFDYTNTGTKVYEYNNLLAVVDSIKLDYSNPSRIRIKQDAKYYEILVDCDTLYKGLSGKPGTEYIIMQTLNSEALVSGISIEEINGFEEFYTNTNLKGKENLRTNSETIVK